ncbi:hypothetical protein BWQ96_08227 [Gracilariopsis chorda]|uniref:C2 domain-containing protein n=1 Tax=Gracilariopsis chorda TaxID=448386 RepID=A0A2V3IJ21_9FLOR|nr:hypothetical protein BWQ96_08227 [Gracilariopsis chorda]|eukprot:PXF42059.1 hypothetical protein BWQ96_08227 [Gracilariopsis chorda]
MKLIELFLSCDTLAHLTEKPLRTFAVLFKKDGHDRDFTELGRTETVCQSDSPHYCTSFEVPYNQRAADETILRVEIYQRKTEQTERLKDHDFFAKATISMPDVLMAPGNHLTTQLSHPSLEKKVGVLTLSAEQVDADRAENNSDVLIDMSACVLRRRDWNKTILCQRYELHRAHNHEDMEGHTVWLPIHKSDRIGKQRDSNTTIEFSTVSVKYRHLCNGDDERRMRISMYSTPQSNKRPCTEALIGLAIFTLRDICELDPTEEVLQLERIGDDCEELGHVSIVKAEPTDYGSHFSLHVNYENTSRYCIAGSEEKRKQVKKMKKRLSITKRLSLSSKDKSNPASTRICDLGGVDNLFTHQPT